MCVPPSPLWSSSQGCFRYLKVVPPVGNVETPVWSSLYLPDLVCISVFPADIINDYKQWALICGLTFVSVALVEMMPKILWNLSLKLFPNVPSVPGSAALGSTAGILEVMVSVTLPWGLWSGVWKQARCSHSLRGGCYLLCNLNFPGSLMPDVVSI